MSGKLAGKVAIVTASTEGIGLAIAKRLSQDGASVVVSSRKLMHIEKAVREIKANGGKVLGLVCHVGKAKDRTRLIEQTISTFGAIDILVCNAGVGGYGPVFSTTENQWDEIFDINVKSTFFLCKEAIPHMDKRGGGSIVIVSSRAGYAPRELIGIYGASKTALLGLTKAMVPQCASKNIRVNCIAPGIIKTAMTKPFWTNQDIVAEVTKDIPMARMGRADECSGAVSFLVSEDASYITGETIVMAGGLVSRL